MKKLHIQLSIEKASQRIGKTWPLYSFVTSNPLSGYEQVPFQDALSTAGELLNAKVFPDKSLYRQAWEQGEIKEEEVLKLLNENGLSGSPDFYLKQLESEKPSVEKNENHLLDRIMVKWLGAFLDEGLAEWDIPNKKDGFYKAWRQLAPYDRESGLYKIENIPESGYQALEQVLDHYDQASHLNILNYHLAALPGWIGYINYRCESNSAWQQEFPISIEDYLGVRLWTARALKAQIEPNAGSGLSDSFLRKIQYIWLKAWENSWQKQLIKNLNKKSIEPRVLNMYTKRPEAQLVFCIDTRSEQIRRHVESKGNYETFGYAGFFGIAMDYESLEDGLVRKSCPPILSSAYKVSETPQKNKEGMHSIYKRTSENLKFTEYFLKRMKNMLPASFGFVEGSGLFYGLSLLSRTILPKTLYSLKNKKDIRHESFSEPDICSTDPRKNQPDEIPLNEKVAIVKSAFDLTGWNDFAPLVVFVGHGSHTVNNPFGSSLDCGACAANPGRHNARMLAKLANEPKVRRALAEKHKLFIRKDTVFIGAEHNTTTDEIVLFDSQIPASHKQELKKLKSDLRKAQRTATQEKLGNHKDSIGLSELKANNWAETRPEWGLAKNAGFIIAPRSLTKDINLDGRCFLHSYDWKKDITGKALEAIMQGPMVVTQWINNHYYFSTVDNEKFGGGSKISHNITGKFGVVQGNGGDLKMGLPLQSLYQSDTEMYHQPLRLSVLIQSPIEQVEYILHRNENLKELLDNEWIYLMVMDPLNQNEIKQYDGSIQAFRGRSKDNPKQEPFEKKDIEMMVGTHI
jgi:hypothetical protein